LYNIPAGLVEEKVLAWLFNALEIYIQLVRRAVYHRFARFSRAIRGAPVDIPKGKQ
jgi:hypothetical protein